MDHILVTIVDFFSTYFLEILYSIGRRKKKRKKKEKTNLLLWRYVHTPLMTGADCEGAGEMFQVLRLASGGAAARATSI